MRTGWPFTKKNSAIVPAGFQVQPRQCEAIQVRIAELMFILKYRKMVEKEIDRVEDVIRKLNAKIAPFDAQARTFYARFKDYFPADMKNIFPTFTPKNIQGTSFNTNKIPKISQNNIRKYELFYGSSANYQKMGRSMLASVVRLLDVYEAREPLDAQHGKLSLELGKLYDNLSAVDKKMASMAKELRACLPRLPRNNEPYRNEENLR